MLWFTTVGDLRVISEKIGLPGFGLFGEDNYEKSTVNMHLYTTTADYNMEYVDSSATADSNRLSPIGRLFGILMSRFIRRVALFAHDVTSQEKQRCRSRSTPFPAKHNVDVVLPRSSSICRNNGAEHEG